MTSKLGTLAAALERYGSAPERRIELVDANANAIASYVDGVTFDANGDAIEPAP